MFLKINLKYQKYNCSLYENNSLKHKVLNCFIRDILEIFFLAIHIFAEEIKTITSS